MGKFDTEVCKSCRCPHSEVKTSDSRLNHMTAGLDAGVFGAGIDEDGNFSMSALAEIEFPLRQPEAVEEKHCSTPTCKEGIKNVEESLEELNDSLENVHANADWNELSEIDLERTKTIAEDFRESFEHEGRMHMGEPDMLERRKVMFEDRAGDQIQELKNNMQNIIDKQEILAKSNSFTQFSGIDKMSEMYDIQSNFSEVEQQYQKAIKEAQSDVEADTEPETDEIGPDTEQPAAPDDATQKDTDAAENPEEATAPRDGGSGPEQSSDAEKEIEDTTPDSTPSSGTGTDGPGPGWP